MLDVPLAGLAAIIKQQQVAKVQIHHVLDHVNLNGVHQHGIVLRKEHQMDGANYLILALRQLHRQHQKDAQRDIRSVPRKMEVNGIGTDLLGN